MDIARVTEILNRPELSEVDVANLNAPTQTVLAGAEKAIEHAKTVFAAQGARVVTLKVQGPFHSRHMRPIADEFYRFLQGIKFSTWHTPVWSNVTAQIHVDIAALPVALATHLYTPVRWLDTMQRALATGCVNFVEMGSRKLLMGMLPARFNRSNAVMRRSSISPDSVSEPLAQVQA